MRSYDYRKAKKYFNSQTVRKINHIYEIFMRRVHCERQIQLAIADSVEIFKTLIKSLKQDYSSDKSYLIYSDFLQHLIYFLCHNKKETIDCKLYIAALLKDENIFVKDIENDNEIHIWRDCKTGFIALHALVINNHYDLVKDFLNLYEKSCGSKNSVSYKNQFLYSNKHGYNVLHTAIVNSDFKMLELLLANVIQAFSNCSEDFQKLLLMTQGKRGYSILHLASAKDNYTNGIKLLLQIAASTFGIGTENFTKFLMMKCNRLNSTCMQLATRSNNIDTNKLILDYFGQNISSLIPNKTRARETLSLTLARNDHKEPVQSTAAMPDLKISELDIKALKSKIDHDCFEEIISFYQDAKESALTTKEIDILLNEDYEEDEARDQSATDLTEQDFQEIFDEVSAEDLKSDVQVSDSKLDQKLQNKISTQRHKRNYNTLFDLSLTQNASLLAASTAAAVATTTAVSATTSTAAAASTIESCPSKRVRFC